MQHYFEIKIIPQIELRDFEAANHVMQQLHLSLVNYDGKVGVSFPAYSKKYVMPLSQMRLFAQKEILTNLYNELITNSEVTNYAVVSEILNVPAHDNYLVVNRLRQKGPSALRRAEKRLKAQGKWSAEVEKNMQAKWDVAMFKGVPHFQLTSGSTGQKLTLWIKQTECDKQRLGIFNSYGLSDKATVPNF